MLPGCTSATRTVDPAEGAGPSQNHAGPSPAHATATAAATTRAYWERRCRITTAIAVFAATIRKLVSNTPRVWPGASVTGWFHCDAPSNAHGPPRLGQDRTASAITHALGNTTTAARLPWALIGTDSSRCAAHPQGSHNAPSPMASATSSGPALGSSQYWVASTYPAIPHHARATPDGQGANQRPGTRQQPVLGSQYVPGHTAPRPHSGLPGGGRGERHQQQGDNTEPRQPPPRRRGKRECRKRADDECRRAPAGGGQLRCSTPRRYWRSPDPAIFRARTGSDIATCTRPPSCPPAERIERRYRAGSSGSNATQVFSTETRTHRTDHVRAVA